MSELNLVLLGPPGAGKGTQGRRLQEDFSLPYVATGDMLREAVREDTELGREVKKYMNNGDLVPDALIIAMIKQRLGEPDTGKGFILDGFPRTSGQAEALDQELDQLGRSLSAALHVDVNEDEVMRRLSGRRVCVKEGHNYHVEFDPPKHPDRCDRDGSRLIQREDDSEEVVRHRLDEYHDKTEPLIGYYEEKGILRRIDGSRDAEQVQSKIRATLAALKFEPPSR